MEKHHDAPPIIPKRVRTPLGRRLRLLLSGPVQLVAWLSTGVFAFWMIGLLDSRHQVLGTVLANEAQLALARGGTIEEMFVESGTIVSAGMLLARLDGTALDANCCTDIASPVCKFSSNV